jgi:DnaJ-class molecular chaperone
MGMPIKTPCGKCKGTGKTMIPAGRKPARETDCEQCGGRGFIVSRQS